jgi:paraquat-inducible protein A
VLAFAAAGLIFAIPAATLPLITAEKLGNSRASCLFTGVKFLWDNGMPWLAVPVFLFGALVPVALLGCLVGLLAPPHFGRKSLHPPLLDRVARLLANWAMPEVQVLAVLVALMKLGAVVNVTVGPGFWCYAAMSVSLLIAWRNFELGPKAAPST